MDVLVLEADDVLLDFFEDDPKVFRNLTRSPIMCFVFVLVGFCGWLGGG